MTHKEKERKEKEKEKEKGKKNYLKLLTGSLHYCTLLSKEFLLFSSMPLTIETVAPIWTTIAVRLMIAFAVHAFEDMWTQLAFLGGRTIRFFVFHATPRFLSVVFGNVGSIALCTPGDMRATAECRMTPLPTVLTLRDTWVHVGTFDGSDESSYVETTIDNVLRRRTTLGIPDVHPDHHHV